MGAGHHKSTCLCVPTGLGRGDEGWEVQDSCSFSGNQAWAQTKAEERRESFDQTVFPTPAWDHVRVSETWGEEGDLSPEEDPQSKKR